MMKDYNSRTNSQKEKISLETLPSKNREMTNELRGNGSEEQHSQNYIVWFYPRIKIFYHYDEF